MTKMCEFTTENLENVTTQTDDENVWVYDQEFGKKRQVYD